VTKKFALVPYIPDVLGSKPQLQDQVSSMRYFHGFQVQYIKERLSSNHSLPLFNANIQITNLLSMLRLLKVRTFRECG
jgi:hypothetical protein